MLSTYVELPAWRHVPSSPRRPCPCWPRCAISRRSGSTGTRWAKQTGLKSGTLYPILIRLADRGLVEACWQDEPAPGRPRRHLYRADRRRAGQRDGGAGPARPNGRRSRRRPRGAGTGKGAGPGPARAGRTWRGGGDDVMNRLEFAGVGEVMYSAAPLGPRPGSARAFVAGVVAKRGRRVGLGAVGDGEGLDAVDPAGAEADRVAGPWRCPAWRRRWC